MGKEKNGNVKVRAVMVALAALVVSGCGWWLQRIDTQAVAQGATITEHAVKIARTEEQLKGVREDVAEVKAHLTRQDEKLDSQAATLNAILTAVK